MSSVITLKFNEPEHLEKVDMETLCDTLPNFSKILEDAGSTVIIMDEDYRIFAEMFVLAYKKRERERIISMGKRYGVDLTGEYVTDE